MKASHPCRPISFIVAGSIAVMLSSHTAPAATLYWDTNSTTAGFGTASGTWGTDAFWNDSATGGAGTFVSSTTTGDPVNFGNGATGLGAGTIGVGTVSSGNMTFASGSGAITLSGGTITLAAAETITVNNAAGNTISSVLAGAATSLTKSGTGSLTLSGANTYTGSTVVGAGTLTLSGNRTVTAGSFNVGNVASTTGTLNISNGTFTLGTFQVGLGLGSTTAGIVNQTGGTLTLSGNQLLLGNGGTGTTAGSNATGTYNLSGGTLNPVAGALGVVVGTNTGTTGNFNLSGTGFLNMPATSTLQITRSDSSAANNVTGTFTQTGGTATVGILQMGGGTATPANNAGANATLTVTGGTFSAATFNALSGGNGSTSTINLGGTAVVTLPAFPTTRGTGATATINFDGGILKPLVASTTYMGGLTNAFLKSGGATFDTVNGSITVTQALLTDAVSTGGGLTKTGANILTLTGANTYTGKTSVNRGTLRVDFNQAGAPASDILLASSPLVLGGAPTGPGLLAATFNNPVFSMVGLNGGNSSQTVGGLTVNPGGVAVVTVAAGTGSAGAVLNLGAITHNPGGMVNFTNPAGTLSATNGITTTNSNSNGILGGWAILGGTAYAKNDGTNIVAYTGYTPLANAGVIASDATSNVQVQAAAVATGSTADGVTTDINTLSSSPAATVQDVITIGAAGTGSTGILRLGAQGGIMVAAGGSTTAGFTIGDVVGNGKLTAGGADNTAGEITIATFNTTANSRTSATINANIVDNGTGAVTLTIGANTGTVSTTVVNLAGTNTYTGGTFINSGRVTASTNTAFGATSGIVTVAAGAQVFLTAPSGSYGNEFDIAGGGTNFADTPAAIRLSGRVISGTVKLLADAAIASSLTTGELSGKITGNYNLTLGRSGTGGAASGTVTISNTGNDWGGNLIISEGTVALGNSDVVPDGAAAGNVVLSNTIATNATFNLNGKNETINGLSSATSAVGIGTVTNAAAAASASVLTLGGNDATATFNGVITEAGSGKTLAIVKTGTGTQTFGGANLYTGGTTINAGILKAASTTAFGSATGASLTFGSGSTGAVQLNGNSMTIVGLQSNATVGAPILESASGVAGTDTLTVNNATANTFGGILRDGGTRTLSLIKGGAGALTLSGANTYSGSTTVSAGALLVSGSVSGSTISVTTGGTLGGNGGKVGTVNVTDGIVAPGAGIGTLNTGDFSLTAASTLQFELGPAGLIGGTDNDLLNVTGALTLDGTLVVTELGGFGEGTYRLFNYSGALTDNELLLEGAFLLAHPGAYIDASTAQQINLVVVPEPSAAVSLFAGTFVLLGLRRRTARSQVA